VNPLECGEQGEKMAKDRAYVRYRSTDPLEHAAQDKTCPVISEMDYLPPHLER
jgi:hypothetical protein